MGPPDSKTIWTFRERGQRNRSYRLASNSLRRIPVSSPPVQGDSTSSTVPGVTGTNSSPAVGTVIVVGGPQPTGESAAMLGNSQYGVGVHGISGEGNGVYGISGEGNGVYGSTGGGNRDRKSTRLN